MTINQIKWAKAHDWYVDKSADNDAVLVREEYDDSIAMVWFDNFRELRAWAGY